VCVARLCLWGVCAERTLKSQIIRGNLCPCVHVKSAVSTNTNSQVTNSKFKKA
jgi:hypothetical protein